MLLIGCVTCGLCYLLVVLLIVCATNWLLLVVYVTHCLCNLWFKLVVACVTRGLCYLWLVLLMVCFTFVFLLWFVLWSALRFVLPTFTKDVACINKYDLLILCNNVVMLFRKL